MGINFFVILALCLHLAHGYPSLRQLTDEFLHLECPHWDPLLGVLYMVDQPRGFVIKFDPNSETTTQVYLGSGELGAILTVEGSNKTFIAARGHDLIKFDWDGLDGPAGNVSLLASVEQQLTASALSCGQVDSRGRIWIGTYSTDKSNSSKSGLYMIDPANNFSVTLKLNNVSQSSGITWNRDNDELYFVDVPTHNVDLYDFDEETGQISNRRVFYNTIDTTFFGSISLPGGVAIDNNTNLWLAATMETGAGYATEINITDGSLMSFSSMTPKLLTSLAWGGYWMNELYVTTSRLGLTDEDQEFWYRGSGALFSFADMEQTGYPPNKVKLPSYLNMELDNEENNKS